MILTETSRVVKPACGDREHMLAAESGGQTIADDPYLRRPKYDIGCLRAKYKPHGPHRLGSGSISSRLKVYYFVQTAM